MNENKNVIKIVAIFLLLSCPAFGQPFRDSFQQAGNDPARLMQTAKNVYRLHLATADSAAVLRDLKLLESYGRERKDPMTVCMAGMLSARYLQDHFPEEKERIVAYLEESIRISREEKVKAIEIEQIHKLGMYYYSREDYPKAFEYVLKSNRELHAFGYEKLQSTPSIIYDMAIMYYEFGYYERAIQYLEKAIPYMTEDQRHAIWIYNALALSHQSRKQRDSAYYYFRKVLDIAERNQDTIWTGIAKGNLGYILVLKKQYEKAVPLLEHDIAVSKRYKIYHSVTSAYLSLCELAFRTGDEVRARIYLDSVAAYLPLSDDLICYYEYYRYRARSAYNMPDYRRAYLYLDSFILFRDSLQNRRDAGLLARAEAKAETEKHLARLQVVETEKSKQLLFRNAVVLTLVLVLIIVLQIMYRLRQRQKQHRKLFEIEKKRAEEQLVHARQQLDHYLEMLRGKNELIRNFQLEIKKLEAGSEHSEQREIIEKLQHSTILTEMDWIEFKKLFQKVHDSFFENLQVRYPEITQAEMRFLALAKLKLSVQEMAAMLGISPASVRKTRLRVRKKTGLPSDKDLETIL